MPNLNSITFFKTIKGLVYFYDVKPSYSTIKQKRLLGLERTWSFWSGKELFSLAPKSYGRDRDTKLVISESGTKEG